VKFREKADEYVHYTVKPNFPLLGKRLGKMMKATKDAISAADPNLLKRTLDSAGKVALTVESEEVVLTKDELTVEVVAKEGFAAATAPVGVVVLDTTVTPELEREGLFREVLSRVQKRRKDLQLDFAARIKMGIVGDPELLSIVQERQDELKRETLCTELVIGKSIGGDAVTADVEGKALTIEVATK
jgi:isoleucyl-tRNA synthetase